MWHRCRQWLIDLRWKWSDWKGFEGFRWSCVKAGAYIMCVLRQEKNDANRLLSISSGQLAGQKEKLAAASEREEVAASRIQLYQNELRLQEIENKHERETRLAEIQQLRQNLEKVLVVDVCVLFVFSALQLNNYLVSNRFNALPSRFLYLKQQCNNETAISNASNCRWRQWNATALSQHQQRTSRPWNPSMRL